MASAASFSMGVVLKHGQPLQPREGVLTVFPHWPNHSQHNPNKADVERMVQDA